MKLHSPAFEKALKRGVKQAVRADPRLRKEARRGRPHRQLPRGFVRVFLSLFLADAVWGVYHQTRHVDSALATISLWLLILTLNRTQMLVNLPYKSRDLWALGLLPVDDSIRFRWELDKFFRQSLYLLWDIAVGLVTLGLSLGLPALSFVALAVITIFTWATANAVCVVGAARFPRLPYLGFAGGLYLVGFVAFMAHNVVGREYLHMADRAAPVFNCIIPFAWPLSLTHLAVGGGSWRLDLLILPMVTLIWLARDSLPLIEEHFHYREWIQAEAADVIPGNEAEVSTPDSESSAPSKTSIGIAAIEEGILSGRFLAREQWAVGWIETKLWQWFSPGEKTLAEFAFPNGFSIFRPWRRIFQTFVVTGGLGAATGFAGLHVVAGVITALGLIVVSGLALGQVLATGAAFRQVRVGGVSIPFHSAFPVSYHGLSTVLCKCSLIQMPLVALLTTPTLMAAMLLTRQSLEQGVLMGIKSCIVLFGGRLLMLVLAFSSSTADTSSFRWRTLGQILFFIAFGAGYLLLGGAAIFVPFELISWICCGAALSVGLAFHRLYGWSYNANRFDLMRPVQ